MAADRIVLNTPRFRGEYEFDIEGDPLTALEWRWVKKISGYLPLTIGDGWDGGDPDLFVAFAVVALARAGKIQKADALATADALSDLPVDGSSISLIAGEPDEEEAEADPPPVPADPPETGRLNGNTGPSSSLTLALQEADPSRTGALA